MPQNCHRGYWSVTVRFFLPYSRFEECDFNYVVQDWYVQVSKLSSWRNLIGFKQAFFIRCYVWTWATNLWWISHWHDVENTACSWAIIDSVLDLEVSYLHCLRIQKCFMLCGLAIFCPKERGRDGVLWTDLFASKTGTCGRHCNGHSRSIKEGNLLSSWGIVNLSRTLFFELCFLTVDKSHARSDSSQW